MNVNSSDAERLYSFWFGQINISETYVQERVEVWFKKNQKVDEKIKESFSPLLEAHSNGLLKDWEKSDLSTMALIVLLDQFPRHIYRNSKRAHAYDNTVLDLVLSLMEKDFEKRLTHVEKLFLYLPLQHSELMTIQDLSLKKFTELLDSCPAEWRNFFSVCLDMAQRHHEAISRFGRFPHRNSYLGRTSTPQELELLKNPMYQF